MIALGSLPTWVAAGASCIAAVGTVGTLIAALRQITYERNRRLAQDAQDRAARRREQARLVAAWVGTPERTADEQGVAGAGRTPIELWNGSSEPVYSLVAVIVFIQGAAPRDAEGILDMWQQRPTDQGGFGPPVTTISILPPGRWRVWIHGSGWSGILAGRSGAELAFIDRAGVHWVRRSLGALEELGEPPFEHFAKHGLYGPYDLRVPERVD